MWNNYVNKIKWQPNLLSEHGRAHWRCLQLVLLNKKNHKLWITTMN